jgi:hypothetical protein
MFQRPLQFLDRNVRGRGTVGLFHAPKQRLQGRILVSNHPPAGEDLGVMQSRDAHDLRGSGEPSLETISRWHRHAITGRHIVTMQPQNDECNRLAAMITAIFRGSSLSLPQQRFAG